MASATYIIHATGNWPEGSIQCAWTESTWRDSADVQARIESAWATAKARLGEKLFDGPMCRLETMQVHRDSMSLRFSRTSYKPFLGTNLNHPGLADTHGRDALANPVGVSTLLLSGDGVLILGRRNANVAYYPNRVHPFAGCLEPREPLDVFAEVRRELHEELSLGPADITGITCIGIAEDRSIRQPELIFAARSTRTRGQIESQLDPQEHLGIFTTPATAAGIESAMQHPESFTPVALAAMAVWGGMLAS